MHAAAQSNRNLWIYSLSNAVSRFGGQFQFLAVTSYTYAITGSPLATALQMAVSGLPTILWARWAGRLADRSNPRRVIALVSLVQAVLTLGYLATESVAVILVLNFLVNSAGCLLAPARATLMPQMVGKENLLKANARLTTISGAIQLLAPGLAGSLLVRTGAPFAFLFNAFSYLLPAAAMLFIRLVEAVEPVSKEGALESGWSFLRGRRDLLLILAAYGGYGLGMWAVNAIFYPYATEWVGGGAELVGWSISAYFGAYTLTGFILERWGTHFRNPRLLHAGYLLGALVWVGYAFTKSVPLVLLLSAFDGIIFTLAVTLFETRIQEEAPPQARGRVFALVRAYDELCNISGQVMGGAMATFGGIIPGIRWSAGLTSVLVLGVAALSGLGRSHTTAAKQASAD